MLFAVIALAVVAVGLLAAVVVGQQKAGRLVGERDDVQRQLDETSKRLSTQSDELDEARASVDELTSKRSTLEASVKELEGRASEAEESLRKRTELADAQAMQIDAVSAERDELQGRLEEAEERIVTLAARPGMVVGDSVSGDNVGDAALLWSFELARSERQWRNSVAINPFGDPSPFDDTDDPVRKAVEIEAAALREDVGALITVRWEAEPIDDPARRLMVVRVAQEMLAVAAKAPGAATLVVSDGTAGEDETESAGDSGEAENADTEAGSAATGTEAASAESGPGELVLRFESVDGDVEEINLIPPQISSDLIDIRNETTLALRAPATA